MLIDIEINDQQVTAKRGETILSLLNRNGIKVPTLCNLPNLTPTGSCRMCVVEVEGFPGLVPACSQPVEEWMKIRTHSPRVIKARRTLIELLLAGHPDDCLYCERNNNCELQNLAEELHVRERRFRRKYTSVQIDKACNSIERDPGKCILCGRCVRICNTVIGVSAIDVIGRGSKSMIGTSYNKGLNFAGCVKCGQCIMVCPTGALLERSGSQKVIDALHDNNICPVIHFSPTTPAAMAEEFGLKPGKDALNILRAALRMMGFRYVLDTSYAADIAIMEDAAMITERLKTRTNIPAMTSSCPSWAHYIRQFRPKCTPNLLTTKSPQQIMGMLVKNFFIAADSTPPEAIFSVSVMPCTAKKEEATAENPFKEGQKSVDVVLTNRELAKLIRLFGIDVASLEPDPTDTMYGAKSSAGKLYGVSGGGLESLLRTVHYMMTGQELSPSKINDLRGMKEYKETRMKIGKQYLTAISVSGLANAIKVLDDIEAKKISPDILDVMACPIGCVNGGGQKTNADEKVMKARIKALYDVDDEEMIKVAHKSPAVSLVYEKMFGKPGSGQAIEMIHNVNPE